MLTRVLNVFACVCVVVAVTVCFSAKAASAAVPPLTQSSGMCNTTAPVRPPYPYPHQTSEQFRSFALSPLYAVTFATYGLLRSQQVHANILSRASAFDDLSANPEATLATEFVAGKRWIGKPSVALVDAPWMNGLSTAELFPWPTSPPLTKPVSAAPAVFVFVLSGDFSSENDKGILSVTPDSARAVVITIDCGSDYRAMWPGPGGAPAPLLSCSMTRSAMISLFPNVLCRANKPLTPYRTPGVVCSPNRRDRVVCACAQDTIYFVGLDGFSNGTVALRAFHLQGAGASADLAPDGALFPALETMSMVKGMELMPADPDTYAIFSYFAFENVKRWTTVSIPYVATPQAAATPRFSLLSNNELDPFFTDSPNTVPVRTQIEFMGRDRDTILMSFINEGVFWKPVLLTCRLNPAGNFALVSCPNESDLTVVSSSAVSFVGFGQYTAAELAPVGLSPTTALVVQIARRGSRGATLYRAQATGTSISVAGSGDVIVSVSLNDIVVVALTAQPLSLYAIMTESINSDVGDLEDVSTKFTIYTRSNFSVTVPDVAVRHLAAGAPATVRIPLTMYDDDTLPYACVSSGPAGTAATITSDPALMVGSGSHIELFVDVPALAGGQVYNIDVGLSYPTHVLRVPIWVEPVPPTLSSPGLDNSLVSPITQNAFVVIVVIPPIVPQADAPFVNTAPDHVRAIVQPSGNITGGAAPSRAEYIAPLEPSDIHAVFTVDGLEPDTPYEVAVQLHSVSGYGPLSSPLRESTLPVCALGERLLQGECRACPSNLYGIIQDVTGELSCTLCPSNSTSLGGSTSIYNCTCVEGQYMSVTSHPVSGALSGTCRGCPDGARCEARLGPNPLAAPGYHDVSSNGVFAFVACPLPEACLGEGRGCAVGYTGYVCSQCASGYYLDASHRCKACPPGSGGTLFAAIFVLSVGSLLFAVITFLASTFSWELSFARETGASALDLDYMARRLRVPPSLRLSLFVMQAIGMLATVRFGIPEVFRRLLLTAHIANFDQSYYAIECSIPSLSTRYALSILYPLAVAVWVLITSLLVHLLASSLPVLSAKYARSSGASLGLLVVELGERVFLTLGPIMYMPLTRTTFLWLDCTKLPQNKGYVMDMDTTVKCYSGEWWALVPLFLFGLAVYVVGIPAFTALRLYQNRESLTQLRVIARLGCVYQLWRRPTFFFGLVLMAQHMVYVGVTVFFSSAPVWVGAFLLILMQSWAVAIVYYRPHFEPLHNSLEAFYSLALISVILVCMVFFSLVPVSNSIYTLMVIVGVTTVLAILLVTVAVAAYEAYSMWKTNSALKKSRGGDAPSSDSAAAISSTIRSRLNARELALWSVFLREVDDFDNGDLRSELTRLLDDLAADTNAFGAFPRKRLASTSRRAPASSVSSTGSFGARLSVQHDDFAASVPLSSISLEPITLADDPAPPSRPSRPTKVSFGEAPARPSRPSRPTGRPQIGAPPNT